METIRIRAISEADFDKIVRKAGGTRLETEGSSDYALNEAFIELKFVEEEGLEKDARRLKLATLFRQLDLSRPVIVIDPAHLDELKRREYFNILVGPIKTHVKKAAKQLERTAQRLGSNATRVLVIVNTGYTALSPDEFRSLSIKCVHNDTTKIDWLICAGIYYHTDGFDRWVLTRFEDIPINLDRGFPSFTRLREEWDSFLDDAMAEHIRREAPFETGKMPVIDLAFEHDGVRFVKPAPSLPRSEFWPGGAAPRSNSRQNESPGPIARSFPALKQKDWLQFKKALPQASMLQNSYQAWLDFQQHAEESRSDDRRPFVPMYIDYDLFASDLKKPESEWEFSDLANFANDLLNATIRSLLENAIDTSKSKIVPIEYLYVSIEEIGRDKANDLCTIFHVCETPGFESKEPVLENIQAYWEESVCLAACYAVKRGVATVVFSRFKLT